MNDKCSVSGCDRRGEVQEWNLPRLCREHYEGILKYRERHPEVER